MGVGLGYGMLCYVGSDPGARPLWAPKCSCAERGRRPWLAQLRTQAVFGLRLNQLVLSCFFQLARENRLALHMISHLLGFIFATSCMITVSIHWFQTSDLTLILHEHLNCELILPTMNAIGISTLFLCALIHAFLVTYIFINHYQQRFSSYYVSYKGKYVMNQKL